jgi:hypothetical protein
MRAVRRGVLTAPGSDRREDVDGLSQGSFLLFTPFSMTNRSSTTPQRTWAAVVLEALRSQEHEVSLANLNSYVEAQAPELLTHNHHWQAKIRQVVQRLRDRGLAENVRPGVWRATPKARDVGGTTA